MLREILLCVFMRLNKKDLLDELEKELRSQLLFVQNRVINCSREELLKSSPTGGWSIIQCLDHLNSYGVYYLPRIESALKKCRESDSEYYQSGWLGDYFTKMMSPDTSGKKYKALKGHIPSEAPEPSSVLSEFIRQEELLLSVITELRKKDIASVRVPISISPLIRLKLGDIIRFIVAHNKRHLLQAARNL